MSPVHPVPPTVPESTIAAIGPDRDQRFCGRVAVVTGGAAGIGAATVRLLAAGGAAVMVGDRDVTGAATLAEELTAAGHDVGAVACDVSREDEVAALVASTVERFGRLDLVDHNAGWTHPSGDTDAGAVDPAVFQRVLDVNLGGLRALARHALPHLVAGGGGSVVALSSGSAAVGGETRVAYGVAKAGVEQLVRHLATRYGPDGVRANAVAPGLVGTASATAGLGPGAVERLARRIPARRLGRPEDVARVVAFLLSDDAAYVSGVVLPVDGALRVAGPLATAD